MTRLAWLLLGAIAVQRLAEVAISRRNQRTLLERGARLVEGDAYPWIATVHVLWFPATAAEILWAPWAGAWAGTWPLLAAYAAAEVLRVWAIRTLGPRWTTRVVVLPDENPVQAGPYRWLDHPNYAAVAVELAALPLAFGAPATALAATTANGLALRRRIEIEEAHLERERSSSQNQNGQRAAGK